MIGQEDRFELWSEAGWLEQKNSRVALIAMAAGDVSGNSA